MLSRPNLRTLRNGSPKTSRQRKLAIEKLDRRDLLAGMIGMLNFSDNPDCNELIAEGESAVLGLTFRTEGSAGQSIDTNNIPPNSVFNLVLQAQDLRSQPTGVFSVDEEIFTSNSSVVEVAMGELQALRFPQAFSSGTFTLTFNGQTTVPIVPPASLTDTALVSAAASRITSALSPILGSANFQIVVNDDTGPAEFIIHYKGQYLQDNVPLIVGDFSQTPGTTVVDNYAATTLVRSEVLKQHLTFVSPYVDAKSAYFTSDTSNSFVVAAISNERLFPSNPGVKRTVASIPMRAKSIGNAVVTGIPGVGNRENLLFGNTVALTASQIETTPLNLRVSAQRTNLGTLQGITERNGLSLLSGEGADWFQFTTLATGNSVHQAAIQFNQAQGDLELELYDASDRLLMRSATVNDTEVVSLRDLPAGIYFLKVSGFGGATNSAYSLRLNTPVVDIPLDRFEANNTRATATDLGAVEGTKNYSDLTIHTSSDTDFYRFETRTAGKAGNFVGTQFSHALGDLDLRLFNSAGDLLGTSETTQNTESISLNGRSAGVYYVQVVGAANAKNPNYSLHLDAPELVIGADRFEPNDTRQTATNLLAPNGTASIRDLSIHQSGNNDWYSFNIVGNPTAAHFAGIDFSHLDGDLDLELYNAQGTKLRESASVRDQERISLAGLSPGAYVLKISGNAGATNSNYSVELALPVQSIAADSFEPNDSRANATDLRRVQGALDLNNLTIHSANNDDWFRFETLALGTNSHFIGLVLSESQGDVDLELLDASGNVLARSATSNDWEIINLAARPAGIYYARVSGYRSGLNPRYSFTIFAPEANIQSDPYENNNSVATASDLRTIEGIRTIESLSIHAAGEVDWFAFSTTAEGTANDYASIEFFNELGDLDLTLWDASENLLSQSRTSADIERISLSGYSAGRYFVRIAGANGLIVNPAYKLTIDAPSFSIPADAYEPNNSRSTAFDLRSVEGVSSVSGATVHAAGNEDWYRFEIRAIGRSTHFVEAEFNHTQGDLDLALYDSLGAEIGVSNSATNFERVSLNGLPAGEYFIKVVGYSGAVSSSYRLNFSAPIFGDLSPDREEANDSLVNASLLRNSGESLVGPLQLDNLSIHSASDVDYYQFTTVGEGTLAHSVSILFSGGDNDLTLELLNTSGAIIRSSSSLTGTEYITLDGLAAGTYLAKVRGVNGAREQYRLAIDAPSLNRLDAWTIMVYMTSSDLDQFAFRDINELEQAVASLPGSVNVAILWDQSAATQFFPTGNDAQAAWSTVGRGFIRPDRNDAKIASSFELFGELNTGNATTLTNFINWAAGEAPAEHYAFVSWDHGAGIFGSNFDNSDNVLTDNLRISEFVSGIRAAVVPRFDVVAFDACLMSMIEVGYNLRSVAEVLVGSQEVVGADGYNYRTAFSNLLNAPGLTNGEQLASNIVNSYAQEYAGSASGWDTQSALRTASLEGLAVALRLLTDLSASLNASQLSLLATILETATSYSNPDFRDLGSILSGIGEEGSFPATFHNAAQAVLQAISDSLVALTNDGRGSSGVSIFVPEGTSLGNFYETEFAEFVSASGWGALIGRTGGQSNGGASGGRFGRSVSIQDWAEDNDLPAHSQNLYRISGANVTFRDLSLHDGKDVDWFRFSIGATGQATDKIYTSTIGSNSLRAELYNSSSNTLLRSSVGSIDGSVALGGLSSGEYLLKVFSTTNSTVRKYSLVATAPASIQAISRLGDISVREKAYPLGVIGNQLALASLELAPGAESWFAVDTPRLAEKRWFSVQVSQAGGGSLNASVFDKSGALVSGDQGSDTLVLGYQATGASERYYLRIKNEKASVASFNFQVSNLVETFSDVRVQERLAGALVDKLPLNELVANVGNVVIKDDRFEWVSGGIRLRAGVHLSAAEQVGVFVPVVVSDALNANTVVEFVLPIKIIENTRPYHNQSAPENVNNDFDTTGAPIISPLDALLVINYLNARSTLNLNVRDAGVAAPQRFVDVNRDGQLSPIDALLVINRLNRLRGSGEGEFAVLDSTMHYREDDSLNKGEIEFSFGSQAIDQVLVDWSASELEQLTKRRTWK